MSYSETIRYLYSLRNEGIKFGLDNITRLLAELDNPHEAFLSVHVAGTNGKGSTSAIIASVLHAAGLRVGLFTSPHLISFTERIQINRGEITEHEVVHLAGEIREIVSGISNFAPTFFEVVTAMALLYFRRNGTDIAVIETGMGGRLDATNIIVPAVSVITNIGYDHKEFLGDTLAEIAYEKACIIKNTIPVVTSSQGKEAGDVISEKARELHSALYICGKDFASVPKKEDISGIYFDYWDDSLVLNDLFLPLIGDHQRQNASVAIKAIELLSNKLLNASWAHFIREGLKNVRWPGRLELVHEDPPILIDGAHNPDAAHALAQALRNLFLRKYENIILVLGIMDDKDIPGVMRPLLPLASEIILTAPSYSRAASPEKLADIAASLGFHDIRTAPTLQSAIDTAREIASNAQNREWSTAERPGSLLPVAQPLPLIVITGSFYTIGEAREVLGEKGVLARLRE